MSAANEIAIVKHSEEHSLNASKEAGSNGSGDRKRYACRGRGWPSSSEATSCRTSATA